MCEILSIAQYYLQLNELSNAVITYQIFIENYCAYFIRKQKGNDFDLIDNRATALKELKKELKDNILMIQPYIPVEWTSSKIKVGLPTEIVFCEHVLQGTAKHDAIIQTFKHFHEKLISLAVAGKDGLDSLRNNIAHNGIGVKSITEINNCINGDFEQIVALWHSTFELPLENVYSTSNKEIENFLRNN